MTISDKPSQGDSKSPSPLFVHRSAPKPRHDLAFLIEAFAEATSTLVHWWGGFAIICAIAAVVFLVWPTWIFKDPWASYATAGWCAFTSLSFAAVALGFRWRQAWAGVAGVILPAISALTRIAAVGLALWLKKPFKWNAGLQIALSIWLAWLAWNWLKAQRVMVELDILHDEPGDIATMNAGDETESAND